MTNAIKVVKTVITITETLTLDGYQKPDGSYCLSANGMRESLNVLLTDKTGKKYAQPILDKASREAEKGKIDGNNSSIRLINLDSALEIIQVYAQLGNKECQALVFACFAETIERRLDNAFGVKRTEENRNKRLKARVESKLTRRTLTDSIKEYIARHPELSENYPKFVYSNCTDCINLVVLGAKSKEIKVELDLKPTGALRDVIPFLSLRELETIEGVAGRFIDAEDTEPLEACKRAIMIMHARTMGYN